MEKRFIRILTAVLAFLLCLFALAGCGGTSEDTTSAKKNTEAPAGTSAAANDTVQTTPEANNSVFKKITGAADETGIYAIVITLSDKAAAKGKVEMVYMGAKGSAQENDVVNTFRIEYEKQSDGTFEVQTFFNGEVYLNYHKQTEVKVINEFGANIRARNVTVTYTSDDGTATEVYTADAEQYRTE